MISVIILTRNEEKNIVDCFQTLNFCDEKIVVDDESEDRTAEIAEKFGAKVFKNALNDDFANQRNFGQEKATGDWVLFVDADERVTPELAEEIIQLTNNPVNQDEGFFIKRRDFLFGKEMKYGETGRIKLLRIAKRNAGKWTGKIHERWEITGQVGELRSSLLHYPHQKISEFLKKINFYTDLRAKELYDKGAKVYWWSIILYPKGKFLLNYFIKKGFLDGISGLIFVVLMSFHSFLVRGKLWLLWQRK